MIPTFSPDVLRGIVRQLPRGLAVEGREGPDGRPFAGGGSAAAAATAFYPVVGIAVPSLERPEGGGGPASPARVVINLGDETTIDFNYRLLKATRGVPMRTLLERLTALRAFAVSEVGEEQADSLMEAWSELNDVERNLSILDFGGMLRFGHVLNRWITRPMVPFPEELTAAEKKDYRAVSLPGEGRGAGERPGRYPGHARCTRAGAPSCSSSARSS